MRASGQRAIITTTCMSPSTPDSTVDFAFHGTGIELLSEKLEGLGDMEVVIDGVSRGTVSQHQNPFRLLYRVPIYRNMNLPDGQHTVRIINKSAAGTPITFDGYKVYGPDTTPTNPASS